MARYVFISYSRVDKAYANRLRDAMTKRGVPTWLDTEIQHGDRWAATVRDAIDASTAVVVIMTSAAEQSVWVEKEIHRAEERKKPIMQMLLEGAGLFTLGYLQNVDVRGGKMPEADFFEVLSRLTQDPKSATTSGDNSTTGPSDGRPTTAHQRQINRWALHGIWPSFAAITVLVGALLLNDINNWIKPLDVGLFNNVRQTSTTAPIMSQTPIPKTDTPPPAKYPGADDRMIQLFADLRPDGGAGCAPVQPDKNQLIKINCVGVTYAKYNSVADAADSFKSSQEFYRAKPRLSAWIRNGREVGKLYQGEFGDSQVVSGLVNGEPYLFEVLGSALTNVRIVARVER